VTDESVITHHANDRTIFQNREMLKFRGKGGGKFRGLARNSAACRKLWALVMWQWTKKTT